MKLRAVIAGAGQMGRWHAEAAAHAGAQVVAVVDPDAARARKLAGKQALAATSLDAALSAGADVVHVCTPSATHGALARQSLERGCHVLLEKPAATSGAEGAALEALARAKGRLLVPTHQFRFQPGVEAVLAARAKLGALRHLELSICSAGAEGRDDRDQVAAEIAPHAFSLARAILSQPVGELAWRLDRAAPGEWRFTAATSNGCLLSNLISLSGRPTHALWRVVGEGGTAHADLFHGFATFEAGRASRTYKVARPLAVGMKGLGAAAKNLARRAAEREVAYPGLRQLVERTYAAAAGAAPPFEAGEVADVARAVEALRWR